MATTDQTVNTPVYPNVDFDTRLALASAGMDAIHAHNHGVTLAEAHTAVQAAQEAPELLAEEVRPFQPHPVLKAAGDLIRVRGWVQGAFESPDGALCAHGAIRVAVLRTVHSAGSVGSLESAALDELCRRITAAGQGNPGTSVSRWNDSRGSVDEVLKLLY